MMPKSTIFTAFLKKHAGIGISYLKCKYVNIWKDIFMQYVRNRKIVLIVFMNIDLGYFSRNNNLLH